jgi:hypothetical protein
LAKDCEESVEILIKCPHCGGQSTLNIVAEAEAVSCGLCGLLLFEYETVTDQSGRSGMIYVLSNDEFPGLLKVGCTRRSATQRAQELNSQTGVPGTFVVEAYWRVDDPFDSERAVHERLLAQRLEGKEFFRVSVSEAIAVLVDALGASPAFSRSTPSTDSPDGSHRAGPRYPSVDWRLAR